MAFSMVWHVTAKTTKKTTVWRKTRTANLYEHLQSGRYYAVAWVNGKQVFKSLKTDSAEHAKINGRSKNHLPLEPKFPTVQDAVYELKLRSTLEAETRNFEPATPHL
jgi:hypothetical protein